LTDISSTCKNGETSNEEQKRHEETQRVMQTKSEELEQAILVIQRQEERIQEAESKGERKLVRLSKASKKQSKNSKRT
jgi:hypothetical protein